MWRDDEFTPIWKNIILPSIKTIADKTGVTYKSTMLLRWLLKYRYNKYKNIMIQSYMRPDTTNIDRHKIASGLVKSVLVTKPLYIPLRIKFKVVVYRKKFYDLLQCDATQEIRESTGDKQKTLIEKYMNWLRFLNGYLAIYIAVSILDSYINSDDRKDRFRHNMILPEPFPEPDEDYLLDVCIGFHYGGARGFNPIAFANTLFLWEKYSCRKTQCDNMEKSYRNFLSQQGMSPDDIDRHIKNAKFGLDDIKTTREKFKHKETS